MILFLATAWAGEITLWHAYRAEEKQAIEQACAVWQAAHPGTTVLPVAVPYEGLASKLEAAIPRGNGPDLFIFAHERIATWSEAGIVLPVEALDGA
ncbi:MAG TPA: extracellular solute-binding protein, partial [Myxococcota bacterium]|nr:extracellular solute-binding protein [Myxococcota bacterium]